MTLMGDEPNGKAQSNCKVSYKRGTETIVVVGDVKKGRDESDWSDVGKAQLRREAARKVNALETDFGLLAFRALREYIYVV